MVSFGSWWDGLARSPWRFAALALLALVLFLPGFSGLPPMDRDEPRFAQASKQMLESGDFVAIRFGEEARNKKPVGIYWMQAAAVATGESLLGPQARGWIWLYRVPSLAGAIAVALLTAWAGRPFLSAAGALMAGSLTASLLLLNVEARLATTDAVLAATVVLAMGALARAVPDLSGGRPARFSHAVAFWLALGIGILVKGPLTPLIVGAAVSVTALRLRSIGWLASLRPVPGLLLCLAVTVPWFVLILLRTHGAFLSEAVGHDMLGKVAEAQELHGAPPGSYSAAFWLSAWPLAPFLLLALPDLWRIRREPRVLFLVAFVVPAWLLFEAVPTKLFHYVLPLYPAISLLTLTGLEARLASGRRIGAALAGAAGLLLVLVPAAVTLLAFGLAGRIFALDPAGFILVGLLGLGALACAIAGGRAIRHGVLGRAVNFAIGSAALVNLLVFGFLLSPPANAPLAVSQRLAALARSESGPACPAPLYATTGDREPSLMFATGTHLVLTDAAGAAQFLGEGACRVAFVESRDETQFRARIEDDPTIRLLGRVAGLAINGGRRLDIGVYLRQ